MSYFLIFSIICNISTAMNDTESHVLTTWENAKQTGFMMLVSKDTSIWVSGFIFQDDLVSMFLISVLSKKNWDLVFLCKLKIICLLPAWFLNPVYVLLAYQSDSSSLKVIFTNPLLLLNICHPFWSFFHGGMPVKLPVPDSN